jgi:hypothetical protein
MKNIKLILILLTISYNTLYAQEYIRNGGFELINSVPPDVGYFEDYSTDWSADACVSEPGQVSCNGRTDYHSPDLNGVGPFQNGNFIGGAHLGDRFAGFGNYEIIEQNINTLPNGTTMELTFYIKLDNYGVSTTAYTSSKLKVMIAKKKIQYKEINDFDDFCGNDYTEYKDGLPLFGQEIKTVYQTIINPTLYPINSNWYLIRCFFTVPANGAYDWIGFDLEDTNLSNEC